MVEELFFQLRLKCGRNAFIDRLFPKLGVYPRAGYVAD